MTQAGFEQLQEELTQLESERRESAKRRIKDARMFCDFHEDSEYEAALKELETIENRIATIKHNMQYAEIIKKSKSTIIERGSTVSFQEMPNGKLETYTIVGTEEADPFKGKVSHESPVAKHLLGAKEYDIVTVKTPSGSRQVEIVSVS